MNSSIFAADLTLSGEVVPEIKNNYETEFSLEGNSEFIIEWADNSGQKHRHYLQYKERFNLPNQDIEKIVVYAP